MNLQEEMKLEIENLPVLSETLSDLQKLKNNPDKMVGQLNEIILKDPMITTNLLKITRSPLYGFKKDINDVKQIITLFGMDPIINIIMYDMITNKMVINLTPYKLTTKDFTQNSIIRNYIRTEWVRFIDKELLDKIRFLAFIMDIGKIILSNILLKKGDTEFSNDLKVMSSSDREFKVFKSYSENIRVKMLTSWNFSFENVGILRQIQDPERKQKEVVILKIIKELVGLRNPLSDKKIKKGLELLRANDDLEHTESILIEVINKTKKKFDLNE